MLRTDEANHILGLRLNVWTSSSCSSGALYGLLDGPVAGARYRAMSGTESADDTSSTRRLSRRTPAGPIWQDSRGRRYPALTTLASAVHRAFPRRSRRDPKDGEATWLPLSSPPSPQTTGLYRREHEHDACGVALVATMRGTAGHDIVDHALTALRNLDHRGATGADPLVGDGAGILTQIPDAFFREVVDFDAPAARVRMPSGIAFLPTDDAERARRGRDPIEDIAAERGPAGPRLARRAGRAPTWSAQAARDVHAVLPPAVRGLRRRAGRRHRASTGWPSACASAPSTRREVYFPSLSARTMVYKGMLTTGQLEPFFPDLSDRALRHRAGAGPLALLDQHLPVAGRWPTPTG